VKDDVDADKRLIQRGLITDVGPNKFRLGVEITRKSVAVDLRLQIVVDSDAMALCDEPVDEMAADKPGSSGYQDLHCLVG
jgi:hypothetical protein